MQVDLLMASTLPGEAEVEVVCRSTDELVERLTLVAYTGPSPMGNGLDFLVRDQSGEIFSRSAVDLGFAEGADRIAFFASKADIDPISA